MNKRRKTAGLVQKDSDLYRRFVAEREEILKLKAQMELEQNMHVRFETALNFWIKNYRAEWLKLYLTSV
jgi:hypothetical protein